MSINFATLKGLSIPEGNVTQIADAQGNVLWKQAPSGATVTIQTVSGVSIKIDGVHHSGDAVLTLPIGTVITFGGMNTVYLNNTSISFAGTYDYTVIGNVSVRCVGTQVNPYYTAYIVNIYEE